MSRPLMPQALPRLPTLHARLLGRFQSYFMVWRSGLVMLLAALPGQALAGEPLRAFEPGSLQQIAKQQGKHSYWLVLWDLECGYCSQSMKNLAELQKSHPDLRIVTVATDPIEQQDALQQRLASIGLKSSAWAFGQSSEQALRYAIDPAWRGEKPRAYRYAPGQARQLFVGVLDETRVLQPNVQTKAAP